MTYTKFFHSDAKEKNSNPVTKRTHDTVSCLNTAVNATIFPPLFATGEGDGLREN